MPGDNPSADPLSHEAAAGSRPSVVVSMLLAAMAGGMGWGIRGQYGHETGAMIAGVLVGLVLVLLFCPRAASLDGMRAAALFTLGISVGGSMTYGQTVGLTQDAELIGHWPALGWGLLGLFIKGGLWIAWGAAFLAIGLNGRRYRAVELSLLMLALFFLWFAGVALVNEPFDPANRVLPRVYFSDDWRWEPEAELSPRREVWGGLLVSLVALVLYGRIAKSDRLMLRLSLWGFIAGGLGFSLGQCVQAAHAWNVEWFRTTDPIKTLEPYINWWNMMETTFGMIFGALLALGLWLNHTLIELPAIGRQDPSDVAELDTNSEWTLAVLHVGALLSWNFLSYPAFDRFADQAITMVLIPSIAVVAGRWWPYLLVLPISMLPIAGKTVRELAYYSGEVPVLLAWLAYLALPVAAAMLVAAWLFQLRHRQTAGQAACWALLASTWLFYLLNQAFFRYPWPWSPWTQRTPNALIFSVCALGLTLGAIIYGRGTSSAGSVPPSAGSVPSSAASARAASSGAFD